MGMDVSGVKEFPVRPICCESASSVLVVLDASSDPETASLESEVEPTRTRI
jgi:hypothetical protein